MTTEKIMQRLDRIEEALEKLFTLNSAQNKIFLTLEKAKEKADYYFEYKEGVYKYEVGGKCTLVENEKVLIDNVDNVYWYKKGTYVYKKDGKQFRVKDGITTEI